MRWRTIPLELALLLGLGGQASVQAAALAPETILVVDDNGGATHHGSVHVVDPHTGVFTLLSDFGSGANQGVHPHGVAVQADGTILVMDEDAGTNQQGALFKVDPGTGERTVLSDFGTGSNQGSNPRGLALGTGADVYVVDNSAGTNAQGALFKVNANTGARTVLSDFGSGDNPGAVPLGVAVQADGIVLVIYREAGTNQQGALFKVDPGTGVRSVLSDFGVGANQGKDPNFLALQADGTIVVADHLSPQAALFKIDPNTGERTILSDFDQEVLSPFGVAVQADGSILVLAQLASDESVLLKVDPATGGHAVLGDFGPSILFPQDITVLGFPLPEACRRFPSQVGFPLSLVPQLGPGATRCQSICSVFSQSCTATADAAGQCISDGLAARKRLAMVSCRGRADASRCSKHEKKTYKLRQSLTAADLAAAEAGCVADSARQACLDRCL